MTPLDVKSRPEWDEIVARFARTAGMTACLTDAAGAQLLCHGDRFPLCAAVRAEPSALSAICAQTSAAMLGVVQRSLAPAVDVCAGGLLRVVAPIARDGRLIGQVTACGLAPAGEELDPFLIARELGIAEETVVELAGQTPAVEEAELEAAVERLFRELDA
jgi:ligand-binding sensor protein